MIDVSHPARLPVHAELGCPNAVRATASGNSSGSLIRFRDYQFEHVYRGTTPAQRSEIIALWLDAEALTDQAEAERRSQEAVLLVRTPAGELAGLSTVGLVRVKDGRVFYAYRMFLRTADRVPYLMLAVITATREFLRTFHHPDLRPAGMLHVNENPKLMRPGIRRLFEREGYRYWGTTPEAEDVWVFEFAAAGQPSSPPARCRTTLAQLTSRIWPGQENNLELTPISEVPKPT